MKDDRVYLLHILDAIDRILKYTSEGEAVFFNDPKTQDAVVRNLEVMGEAVKNLSTEIRIKNPDIPWKQIAGMRDKVIHDYFGVNLELVFDVVRLELPGFKTKLTSILETLGPGVE